MALESLACGTPVVSSDTGSIKNVIRTPPSGVIVNNNSAVNLAAGIKEVLDRQENDSQAIQKRRAVVEEYNWTITTDKLLNEFERVLSSCCYP